MSLPRELTQRVVAALVRRLDLHERRDRARALDLTAPGQPAALLRGWGGGPLDRLVVVEADAPGIGLEFAMVAAFAPSTGALPHLLVEVVASPGGLTLFVDLCQRVDVGGELGWIDAAWTPLTAAHVAAFEAEGVAPAALNHRLRALLGPWTIAARCDEAALRGALGRSVDAYVEHWLGLVERGLPAAITADLDPAALAARDRRYRAALFSADVDPIWRRLEGLFGAEGAGALQSRLRGDDG
ncbi:MAG: hypothetical protein R3A79_15040 [Nannocystaceae bacterium]